MQRAGPGHSDAAGGGRAPCERQAPEVSRGAALGRELAGDMPCVVCGYNLRGLSIRGVCPECSTPVRATILAVVDPHASELRPIPHWPVVAAGLVSWTGAALGAALLWGVPRLLELWAVTMGGGGYAGRPDFTGAALTLVGVSGLGAMALVRPHGGLGVARVSAAVVGVVAYGPLLWVLWRLGSIPGLGALPDYLRGVGAATEPAMLRIAGCVLIAVIVLMLRPNARVLVARSLALRQGRVDRQTLAAVALAAMVAAAGDVVALLATDERGGIGETAALAAVGLIAVGSALLTLGLAGALVDCVRISRALRMPGPSLREVLRPAQSGSGAR